MFFFPGCSMEVSGTGIKEHPANGSTLSHYVWEENVLKHKVRLMEDMFTISRKKDIEGNDVLISGSMPSRLTFRLCNQFEPRLLA